MNQLKEDLIWIALGIPGMVLIGLVLHSLVHFETGVLVITSMILGSMKRRAPRVALKTVSVKWSPVSSRVTSMLRP